MERDVLIQVPTAGLNFGTDLVYILIDFIRMLMLLNSLQCHKYCRT